MRQGADSFVPLHLVTTTPVDSPVRPGVLEITLGRGRRLCVSESIDLNLLAEVVRRLEGQAGC
jgi:hypothetical protein